MCLDKSLEGERLEPGGTWGILGWRPPLSIKVSTGWLCGMGARQSEESEPLEMMAL
jgi:hypothetical protein